jgi:hypothetical protein
MTIFTPLVYICYFVFEFELTFKKGNPEQLTGIQTNRAMDAEIAQSDTHSADSEIQTNHTMDPEKAGGTDVPPIVLWKIILLLVVAAVCRWLTLLTVLRAECIE